MKITLNGNTLDIPESTTLQQLINDQGLAGRRLAAEVNRHIIPKTEHSEHTLQENDQIEIVHAIGGG